MDLALELLILLKQAKENKIYKECDYFIDGLIYHLERVRKDDMDRS